MIIRQIVLSLFFFAFFVVGLLIGVSIAKGEVAQPSLESLYGIAIQSMDSVKTFYLRPGDLNKCTTPEVTGTLSIQKCDVAAHVMFTTPPYNYYEIDKLLIFSTVKSDGDILREFIFRGTWKIKVPETILILDSLLEVKVYYYDKTPGDMRGYLYLDKYNLRYSVEFKKFNKRIQRRR